MSIEAIVKANRNGCCTQYTRRHAGLEKGTPEPDMQKNLKASGRAGRREMAASRRYCRSSMHEQAGSQC